jgi:sialic acid synthase SpsE
MKIIADIGSNFYTTSDLLRSIKVCSICGADVFKIQYLDMHGVSRSKLYDLDRIKGECDEHGIEFLASVFDPMDVEVLNPYVDRWKIASCEAKHFPLLRMVERTNKPVIISTGAYDNFDHVFGVFLPENVTLLACESEYPSRRMNLKDVEIFTEMYECDVGLSDHSADVYTTAWAAQRLFGINVVEKHVNPLELTTTPDSGIFSLNGRDFYRYCHFLKTGNYDKREIALDLPRRNACSLKEIHPGDRLEYGVNWSFERSISTDDKNEMFDCNDGIMYAISKIMTGSVINARDIGI